jgi:hypothetical protein
MTGAFLRVKRDGRWENIEVEHLTSEERAEIFTNRDDDILPWFDMVCNLLAKLEEVVT